MWYLDYYGYDTYLEGNDKVLAFDIHGHAVRELLFYEELPWDNWDEK